MPPRRRGRAARRETRSRPRSGPLPTRPGRRRAPTRRAWRPRGGAPSRGGGAGAGPAGNGRRAGCAHRSRTAARRQADLDPRAERAPDPTQRAAVQLDGVACDDQTVTAARLPRARADIEERAASGRPRGRARRPRRDSPLMRPVTVTGPRPCSTAFATRLSSACVRRMAYPCTCVAPARQSRATWPGAARHATRSTRRRLVPRPPGGRPTRACRTARTGKAPRAASRSLATSSARS